MTIPTNLLTFLEIMNWHKLSQAAFQTFNLEDKITNSFLNLYTKFIKDNPNAQQLLDRKLSIYIGSTNISKSLQPIIKNYGEPKNNIPDRIYFVIASSKHPVVGKDNAFFTVDKYQDFIIGKVINNVAELTNIEKLKYDIQHELQHFLKRVYEGERSKGKFYYEEPSEIQSYTYIISKKAIDEIKDLYAFRIQHVTKENIPNIKNKIIGSKDILTNKFLLTELKKFMDDKNLKPEIRKQYYLSTIKNFNRFFDEFVNGL